MRGRMASWMQAFEFPVLSSTVARMCADKGEDVLPFVGERISGTARLAQVLGTLVRFLAPLPRIVPLLRIGKAERRAGV